MPLAPKRGALLPVLALTFTVAFAATPAHALGLAQVLAEVDAADPTLAAHRDMARAAHSRADRAGAWDAPMLDLMLENVPVTGQFDMDPMTMKVIGFEQRLDVFGSRGLSRRAAQRDAGAADASAEAMRFDRLGMAWATYAAAWSAGERAAAAREHSEVMDRMVAAGRARYESGRGRLDDLLRAEAERARVTSDAVRFDSEERAARARLDALRGRTPGGAPESLEPPAGLLAADGDAAWAGLTDAHPRVRAAGEREAARRASVQAMNRMGWPELTVRASYGFREDLAAGHGGVAQDNMWSAGVGILLPIGNDGRQGAEAAEMSAMADAAAAERRAESLGIAAEIEALRARARADQRAVTLIADTVLVAQRRALAASWSAYETGSTDLAGVLDAAHASYAEELEAVRTREDLATTLARVLVMSARLELVGMALPAADSTRRNP
jgi:outer membrane protein TolC